MLKLKATKLSCVTKLALSISLLVASGIAAASGTTTLTVNAKISGGCKVSTAPALLDFGTIDPNSTANAVATQTFAMKCSNGTTSTATTDDNGLHFAAATKNMAHSVTATALLPYALAYTNDTGFAGAGFGAAAATRVVTVTGTITPAQFSGALATTGAQIYADTVVITVNP